MVTEKKQAKKNIKTKKVDEVLPLQNTEIPTTRQPDETVNSQKPEQKTATKVVKKKQAKTGVEIRAFAIEKSKLKKSINKIVEVDGDATQRTPILKRISFYLKYHTTVGENIFVTGRTIDTHIAGLRKKLGESANMIETIRGIGYRFKDVI